jgi:hypothetical protein
VPSNNRLIFAIVTKEELLMSYITTIKELEESKKDLLSRVKQIDETITTLRAMSSFSQNGTKIENVPVPEINNKYKGYDKNSTTKAKMALILKTENRFLNIRQIAELLHSLEPDISAKDFTSKLYPAISDLKKTNSIVKYAVGTSNNNVFWGSKNWLDEDGKIKQAHQYDADQITDFSKEQIEI